jgi:hypothetical protein
MRDDVNANRPTGLYVKYIQRMMERRIAAGLPIDDICPNEYWAERAKEYEERNKQNE